MYERVDVVSEEDAGDLLQRVRQLRMDVVHWLKTEHAALVPLGM
jgi:hypothetical protein